MFRTALSGKRLKERFFQATKSHRNTFQLRFSRLQVRRVLPAAARGVRAEEVRSTRPVAGGRSAAARPSHPVECVRECVVRKHIDWIEIAAAARRLGGRGEPAAGPLRDEVLLAQGQAEVGEGGAASLQAAALGRMDSYASRKEQLDAQEVGKPEAQVAPTRDGELIPSAQARQNGHKVLEEAKALHRRPLRAVPR